MHICEANADEMEVELANGQLDLLEPSTRPTKHEAPCTNNPDTILFGPVFIRAVSEEIGLDSPPAKVSSPDSLASLPTGERDGIEEMEKHGPWAWRECGKRSLWKAMTRNP